MDEIISYKLCAVKVRNAKLQNYLKSKFDCNSTSHQPGVEELYAHPITIPYNSSACH
jgi:hypothetical protein